MNDNNNYIKLMHVFNIDFFFVFFLMCMQIILRILFAFYISFSMYIRDSYFKFKDGNSKLLRGCII